MARRDDRGGLMDRVLAGEKLRPPARTAAEQRDRLCGGEAWRDFCRTLERAGSGLLDAADPRDNRTLAEGHRYLMGLASLGIRQFLEAGNPDAPMFTRVEDAWAKWGAENADNHYLHANIRSDRSYRIRGERGTSTTFLVEVKEGFMQMGDVRNFATLCAEELEIAPDGSFEIVASADQQQGNWLPIHPDATQIVIRDYLCRWEQEEPARFTIECIDTAGLPLAPPAASEVAHALDGAAHFVDVSARFWSEWMPRMWEQHVEGRLEPAVAFTGGADDIRYGNDVYSLPQGEALVIESDVPDARYWSYQLGGPWFTSTDYANRISSLNHTQTHVDADGRIRIVVAHEDPGCPNWLDAAGCERGMIQYRYVWTNDSPRPRIERIDQAGVLARLPDETPHISPEQRREQIARRQAAIRRRMRY